VRTCRLSTRLNNLGVHPYQAYSRDAFMQQEREAPAQRSDGSDRGCPLGTGVVRPMWHAAGTNGGLGAGRRTPRDGAPPKAGHHHVAVQAELTRRGCTFGLTCQDAGAGRIRRAHIRGNDLEQFSQSQAAHQIKGAASSQLQRRASPVFAGHDYVGKPPSGGAAAGCPLSKLPRTSCHSARFPVQFASSLPICTGKCTA
jgi:hypothetical protein